MARAASPGAVASAPSPEGVGVDDRDLPPNPQITVVSRPPVADGGLGTKSLPRRTRGCGEAADFSCQARVGRKSR